MSFVPYQKTKENYKERHKIWYEAFLVLTLDVEKIKGLLFARTKPTWNDIYHVAFVIENKPSSRFDIKFDIEQSNTNYKYKKYDIQFDLHHAKSVLQLEPK